MTTPEEEDQQLKNVICDDVKEVGELMNIGNDKPEVKTLEATYFEKRFGHNKYFGHNIRKDEKYKEFIEGKHGECAICLNVLEPKHTVRFAPCKHVFHQACAQHVSACPLCRSHIEKRLDGMSCCVRVEIIGGLWISRSYILEEVRVDCTNEDILRMLGIWAPLVHNIFVRGPFQWDAGVTLLQYQVIPGDDTSCWIFLK